MQGNIQLFCPRCAAFTHHASQGRYDHMGALQRIDERCLRCGRTEPGHEIPNDASIDTGGLTQMERCRCYYQRHRVATGQLTEWPGGPGVWG